MVQSQGANLVEILRERAAVSPDRTAFRYLKDGHTETAVLSFGGLDLRARSIAARLQSAYRSGSRLLLVFPSGLDHICAFLGCLYAGMIPVPSFALSSGRGLERLRSIMADCRPDGVLSSEVEMASKVASRIDIDEADWIDLNAIPLGQAANWVPPRITPESIALLQYTSGATSTPKGILVTHANLLANEQMICSAFRQTSDSVIVGWLPFHHDMGLIGNLLQPIYSGSSSILMSPGAFLRRPSAWLEAISKYRASTSGGPDFAYSLAVKNFRPEGAASLDLSSWSVAFNGSEPVRAETIEAFSRKFAPYGFRREAFQPCYGLAEATLFVCGARERSNPSLLAVDADSLRKHLLVPVPAAADRGGVTTLVGCGVPVSPGRVAIVDPATCMRSAPGQIGEIWVSGPHVACAYSSDPAANDIFHATLRGEPESAYLRTGDLGCLKGELYVTGRLKELIIIRGQNYYSHDLEITIASSAPEFAGRPGAVFSLDAEDRVAAVQEVGRNPERSLNELAALAREAVAREHLLRLEVIAFVSQGKIPRTSSGKVQRALCREQFLAGSLGVMASFSIQDVGSEASEEPTSPDTQCEASQVEDQLRRHIGSSLGVGPASIAPEATLDRLGLDSLARAGLQAMFAEQYGIALPTAELFSGGSIRELACRAAAIADRQQLACSRDNSAHRPLSAEQIRLWVLARMRPGSPDLNLCAAVRIRGDLDARQLERAVAAVIARHEALRTVFVDGVGGPKQRALAPGQDAIVLENGGSQSLLDDSAVHAQLEREKESVFDPQARPLVRFRLFAGPGKDHVLFISTHHLVVDGWSFQVMVRDLARLYDACGSTSGSAPDVLASLALLAAEDTAASAQFEADQRYWTTELATAPELARFPLATAAHTAKSVEKIGFEISQDSMAKLRQTAAAYNASPFAAIFTAFTLAVGDCTGQSDMLTPAAFLGRHSPGSHHAVGLFARPVLVHTRRIGATSLAEMLLHVQAQLRAATAHQQFPFHLMLEAAGLKRSGNGLLRLPLLFTALPPFEPVRTGHGIELAIEGFEGGNQQVDLLVALQDPKNGGRGEFRVDPQRLDISFVRELRDAFLRYVYELAENPGHALVTPQQRPEHLPYLLTIAATFTAEPLADSLRFWERQLNAEFAISFARAGQVMQELLGAEGKPAVHGPGANVVLVRLSDWDTGSEPLSRKTEELVRAIRTSAGRSGVPHVLCFAPSQPLTPSFESAARLEDSVAEALAGAPDIHVLTSRSILTRYPVGNYRDAEADELAGIPFTSMFFAALGTAIVRVLYQIETARPKVIAVDCDHTLWGGVCGEEGPFGIELKQHHLWLQQFLIRQQREGALLVLCSKNNEADVAAVFELRRGEMPLRRSHFAREALNWRPKSENLIHLAHSLGLGIDSFALIDDNPAECAEVRARCPEVLVLEIPNDPTELPTFFSHVWAFDSRPVSRDDLRRTEYYRNEEVRRQKLASAPTMLEFFRSLDLQLHFAELTRAEFTRASQLTFRTNQFTTTAVRWTASEIESWTGAPGNAGLAVWAADRFGDYGLVSVILYRISPSEALRVESWSLSCRALGRGIEQHISAHLGTLAARYSLPAVSFRFRETGSNIPALEFLKSLGSEERVMSSEKLIICDAASLVGCVAEMEKRWAEQSPAALVNGAGRRQSPGGRSPFRGDLSRIARECNEAGQILAAMRAASLVHCDRGEPLQTPTEEALAALWSELLAVDSVCRTDDFFEVGGDSVLSIRMLAEIRRRFAVDLAIETFFTREPTLAQIANAIDEARAERSFDARYAAAGAVQQASEAN